MRFPERNNMSLLSWFSRKKSDSSITLHGPDIRQPVEHTQPMALEQANSSASSALAEPRPANRAVENAAVREQLKTQSLARREQLYGAVRESLLRIGILAASYKFKVLALDQAGRQYLVMIDVAANLSDDVAKMSQVETLIAANAKSRYDLVVTAVYWRRDDPLTEHRIQTVGATPSPASAEAPPKMTEVSKKLTEPAATADQTGSRYEPLQTEEMLAFKRALAVTANPPAPAATARAPVRGFSPLATGYEDTQVVSPDTRPPKLDNSQRGDLN